MSRGLKTEHNGAKNGGGAWAQRVVAKAESRKVRRENAKTEIREAVNDRPISSPHGPERRMTEWLRNAEAMRSLADSLRARAAEFAPGMVRDKLLDDAEWYAERAAEHQARHDEAMKEESDDDRNEN